MAADTTTIWHWMDAHDGSAAAIITLAGIVISGGVMIIKKSIKKKKSGKRGARTIQTTYGKKSPIVKGPNTTINYNSGISLKEYEKRRAESKNDIEEGD